MTWFGTSAQQEGAVEPRRETPALGGKAEADLRFIRDAMERAGSFTAVSGRGGQAMGLLGLAGAAVASTTSGPGPWLTTWLVTAVVAFVVGVVALQRKARAAGMSLVAGAGWRFALAFGPPLAAGAVLTWVFARGDMVGSLPGVWLLLYGTAVATGGLFSLPVIRGLGLGLMALGVAALTSPPSWGDLWMATGFGGLQIVFGEIIARRYGG